MLSSIEALTGRDGHDDNVLLGKCAVLVYRRLARRLVLGSPGMSVGLSEVSEYSYDII